MYSFLSQFGESAFYCVFITEYSFFLVILHATFNILEMTRKLFVAAIFILLLNSCGQKKLTDEELAQMQLKNAEQCFSSNKLNTAKLHIDSINNLYPKQVAIRKKADLIFSKIQLIEQKRNLIYADSVLRLKQQEFKALSKNFILEKDEKYEDVGNYIFKKQKAEDNAGKTYIKPLVEESGALIISSIYCSTHPIKHHSAKFSVDNVFAETETVPEESGYNYSFVDGQATFENVIYKSQTSEGIAAFIQQNIDKNITVTLLGKKGKTSFSLSTNDKKAISEAYNLSVVLKDIKDLERIIKTAKRKIILYEASIAQY